MQQMPLGFSVVLSYPYGRWVRHAGVEAACNRLALWHIHGGNVWLCSEGMAGKTHLLQAFKEENPGLGLLSIADLEKPRAPLRLVESWVHQLEQKAVWAVDVAPEGLGQGMALALFHLMERARSRVRPLLIASRKRVQQQVPTELSSRLAMMEQIEMSGPSSDADLLAVLRSVAATMQWDLSEAMLEVLLHYLPRDLDSLVAALKQLNSMAMAEGRRITLSWMRNKCANGLASYGT